MNETSDFEQKDVDFFSISMITRYFIFGLMICVTSLTAIVILNKCKKIVEQIRITSIQLCVANLGFGLTLVANAIYLFKTRVICAVLFKLLSSFCLTYFLFLSFTGVDRLLSLTLTIRYNVWMRKRNILLVTGTIYAIAICFGIVLNFQPNSMFQCKLEKGDAFMFIGISIFVAAMLVLMVSHFVCFICIGCIAAKKSLPGPFTRKDVYTTFWRITKKIVKLGLVSVILVMPYIGTRLQYVLSGDVETRIANFVNTSSLVLLCVHQVLSPVIIIVSYYECRYVILSVMVCCNEKWRQKLRNQYIQHYASYEIPCARIAPSTIQEET